MLGDVVGGAGLEALEAKLPPLKAEAAADLTVINGENAAAGFGISGETLDRMLAAGADVVTSGNHVWEKRDFWPVLDGGKSVLRPANYSVPEPFPAASPEGLSLGDPLPGRLWLKKNLAGVSCFVINLQGREMMSPIGCPFRCFDRLYAEIAEAGAPPLVLVDFHAESTEEKEALAYYVDGRASLIAGTHTHVQTADERILPRGTAYITDLGMTGAQNGVIGMDARICLDRVRTQVAYRMQCAVPEGPADLALQGVAVELDTETGKAVSIRRIRG
jgi:metallophosphoesterase (TIGR00282 family)